MYNFVAIKECYHVLVVIFGAFHLVRTQFYMLSGPTHPLFACYTQWKCIGGLSPPPLGAYVIREIPDHATFRGKDVNTGLVRQTWGCLSLALCNLTNFGHL